MSKCSHKADMKTALILTGYFPPAYDVGGKRAYRFARYLPDYGWRPIIVTAPTPARRPVDPGPFVLPDLVEIHRKLYPSWWPESGKRFSDGTIASPVRNQVGPPSLGASLKRQFVVPAGPDALLTPLAGHQISKLAKKVGSDIIFASSGPYACLLYGRQVAKRTGLPLVLDLRDPWTLNFLQANRAWWVQWAERRLEESLFRAADRVTLTCAQAAAAYANRYPDLPPGRIHTIYNSFDPAFRPKPGERIGPMKLVHFGNCYGPRRLAPVLMAIAQLQEARLLSAEEIRILHLGRPLQEDLELARQLQLEEIYSVRPFVPYEEGLGILAQADLLVLLAYGQETLFIPAKFFDYLLAGRAILCLSEPSELTELVERTGSGVCARPGDVDAVARIIAQALRARSDGTEFTSPNLREIEAFSAPATARQLAELFDRVLWERGR